MTQPERPATDVVRGRATVWTAVAHADGLVLVLAATYFPFRLPFQLTDNLANMLEVQAAGLWELLVASFTTTRFLRPFLWANLKVVFDAAGGRYFEVIRAFQAAQLLLVV